MRPSFWRKIPGGWSYVLRIFARRPEDDVDAELRFHFDERIAELTGQGLPSDVAQTRAHDEFGDISAVRAELAVSVTALVGGGGEPHGGKVRRKTCDSRYVVWRVRRDSRRSSCSRSPSASAPTRRSSAW